MKILYGVPSEGMGHYTRSKVIIKHLLEQKHDVQIVSSDRAYKLLVASFPGRVHEIAGFHLAYCNARVDKFKTLTDIIGNSRSSITRNFQRYVKLHQIFAPDLVISDFESFSLLYGLIDRVPVFNINNMSIIDRADLGIVVPKLEQQSYQLAKSIIHFKTFGSSRFFITTFFRPKHRKKILCLFLPFCGRKFFL